MVSGLTCATTLFVTLVCSGQVPVEAIILAKSSSNTVASGASAALSEEGYQQVASLRSDKEMSNFIARMLHKDGLERNVSYLRRLVPWYSGTYAVQSLARLRETLSGKLWERRHPEAISLANVNATPLGFISESEALNGTNVSNAVLAGGAESAIAPKKSQLKVTNQDVKSLSWIAYNSARSANKLAVTESNKLRKPIVVMKDLYDFPEEDRVRFLNSLENVTVVFQDLNGGVKSLRGSIVSKFCNLTDELKQKGGRELFRMLREKRVKCKKCSVQEQVDKLIAMEDWESDSRNAIKSGKGRSAKRVT